jgi:hypothetical protein
MKMSYNDEIMKYRMECLKMAFDFNFKINNIKTCYEDENDLLKDLRDVFYLADMNFNFIANGTMIHELNTDEGEINEI